MKEDQTLIHGSIVQLNPEFAANLAFAGCLVVVDKVYGWGIQGYVQALGESREQPGGQAYIRAKWEDIEPTGGVAVWRVA
jgi:hypothetical protein